jgi:hypothetical protein
MTTKRVPVTKTPGTAARQAAVAGPPSRLPSSAVHGRPGNEGHAALRQSSQKCGGDRQGEYAYMTLLGYGAGWRLPLVT